MHRVPYPVDYFIYSLFSTNSEILNKYKSPIMSLNVLCLCLIVLDIWIKHKITFKLLGEFILNTISCMLKDAKWISATHLKEFE